MITLPDEEANPSLDPAFKKLLFGDVKTMGLTSVYHRETDDLLNEMEHESRAIHNSVCTTDACIKRQWPDLAAITTEVEYGLVSLNNI